MKLNPYTSAIDDLHVPEAAIEAAIAGAKRRAAAAASAQIKVKYAAIAASIVLASVASGRAFYLSGKPTPPVAPVPIAAASQAADPTANAGTASVPASSDPPTEQSIAPTDPVKPIGSIAPSAQPESVAPSAAQTPSQPAPTSENPPSEQPTSAAAPTGGFMPNEPEIDPSQLCADGKAYFAVAATGLSRIDDPKAFSDDHLYFIDTKFGRYYQPKPLEIDPEDYTLDRSTPKSDEICYLYNSDGEIVGTAPVWW